MKRGRLLEGKEVRVLWTTYPADRVQEARALARELVEQRLAACIWLLPQMESFYRWKGELVEDREVALIIKTHEQVATACLEYLRQNHPYEVPEILVWIPEGVGAAYLEWLRRVTVMRDADRAGE